MHEIVNYIVDIVKDLWYTWTFIMMVLESSFFPFPSEVAMVPWWYLVSRWEMNFILLFLSWTSWALVWASINYFLWRYLWANVIKALIERYGKYFLIKMKHYEKTEKFFHKHGEITTFVARLITVVRQLISIPAWIFKMNYIKFLLYTFLWAWIWNIILILIGYVAWENEELIAKYSKEALIWGLIFVIIICGIYYLKNKRQEEKSHKKEKHKDEE